MPLVYSTPQMQMILDTLWTGNIGVILGSIAFQEVVLCHIDLYMCHRKGHGQILLPTHGTFPPAVKPQILL